MTPFLLSGSSFLAALGNELNGRCSSLSPFLPFRLFSFREPEGKETSTTGTRFNLLSLFVSGRLIEIDVIERIARAFRHTHPPPGSRPTVAKLHIMVARLSRSRRT
jgi:hypothetical protein